MNFLQIVHWFANAMACIALLMAFGLMAARLVRNRSDDRRQARRSRIFLAITNNLQDPEAADETVELMARDKKIAAGLLQELAELITGGQRDQLCTLARAAGLDRWLMRDLQSGRSAQRQAAAETLRLFDTPHVVGELKRALEDRDPDVCIAVALSLVELGASPPLPILVQRLQFANETQPLTLLRLFDRIAREDLEGMFAIAEGELGAAFLRPFAIDAIGASGLLEYADRLAAIGDDPDVTVRASVLRAVAALGRVPKRDIIAAGLNDAAWQVRGQAIQAARRLERMDLVPRIAELTEDTEWWVRFRAGECLAALGEVGIKALRDVSASAIVPPPARVAAADRQREVA